MSFIKIKGLEIARDKDKGKGDRQDKEIKTVSQIIAFSILEGERIKLRKQIGGGGKDTKKK